MKKVKNKKKTFVVQMVYDTSKEIQLQEANAILAYMTSYLSGLAAVSMAKDYCKRWGVK